MAVKARKRRLLVVEPDLELRGLLTDFLAAQRFDVAVALTGDEALTQFQEFSPDLVLLSRELPFPDGTLGPDGLRVLKVIKQMAGRERPLPVILTASEASPKDFERYRKLKFSADDYIPKPFEDTELLHRIENLVGFDLSEDLDHIKGSLDDAMDDDHLANIFDADPTETGLGISEATRREVAQLLEQMGQEIERPDNYLVSDEEAEEEVAEQAEEQPAGPGGPEPGYDEPVESEPETDDRLRELEEANRKHKAEVSALRKKLDQTQKQVVSERKRSRETKKEWKQKLQKIASRLAESQAREAQIREQFESMRQSISDMELDHTMELERIQNEKRRAQEEVALLREREEALNRLRPDQLSQDLRKIIKALNLIMSELEGEEEN